MSTAIMGVQEPRVMHFPAYASSAGAEVIEVAKLAGLILDPWQELALIHSLGERPDGKWVAFEIGFNVARQNGKGGILEARELGGLYVIGERLIVHTAHEFATSLEAFRRLMMLIEDTPELDRRVMRVSRAHGEEGIELRGRQRINFRTRTAGGGRGFTGDTLILDEAMILREAAIGALIPTLSARPNVQVIYAGSAVDQTVHDHGVVWARVRERGLRGTDPALAYFEWSADPGEDETGAPLNPSQVPEEIAGSEEAWAQANPALGRRISTEHVARERRSMDPRTFAVERLGIGDWPETDPEAASVIDATSWRELRDDDSTMVDPVCFAFDVLPDRSAASIVAAGKRPDGLLHVEVIERHAGAGWVAGRLEELAAAHKPSAVLYVAKSPAAALTESIAKVGVETTEVTAEEFVKACGAFADMVTDARLRHLGTAELLAAIRGAVTRPLVDAWAWSRTRSKVDVTPLVGATIAAQHADHFTPPSVYANKDLLVLG